MIIILYDKGKRDFVGVIEGFQLVDFELLKGRLFWVDLI